MEGKKMGLFGPSQKEVWKQLCLEINANFITAGFWKRKRVESKHNNWTIYLDTFTESSGENAVKYTRMRAPFVDRDKFYFKIYKKGFFSGLGKALGMQDIQVGYPGIDDNYIIKSNSEATVVRLFSNSRIRELIQRQPKVMLEILKSEGMFGPKFKENESELYFLVQGVMKDIGLLKSLFELFREVLDELKRIGSATGDTPQVKLYK
jgi:hypothetical protein